MPVFNCEFYLADAIDSILRQSFTDFELILIDDGSTDSSGEIIGRYRDSRLVILRNNQNKGLIYSLNRGVAVAQGKYIARMDADDVSLENRLQKQWDFLEKHTWCSLCGTWARFMDANGTLGQKWKRVTREEEVRVALLFHSPLIHPSVMARTEVLKSHPYDDTAAHCEDYALWLELERAGYRMVNLPVVLLYYRAHQANISVVKRHSQRKNTEEFLGRHLQIALSIKYTNREFELNRLWFAGRQELSESDFSWAELREHGKKLIRANAARNVFDPGVLQALLWLRWWLLAYKLMAFHRCGFPRMGGIFGCFWRVPGLARKL
jgi:glycosyltransferase involved in cell wall biosynthesis